MADPVQDTSSGSETSWTVIGRAAAGDTAACERFARLYAPALKAYFSHRWAGSPHIDTVEDAVQEVFLDCLKPSGALERADRERPGGFRAFFYGVAGKIALRYEKEHRSRRQKGAVTGLDLDRMQTDEDGLSAVFDRAWARSIVREAVDLHAERVRVIGGREKLRVEILRLRFEEGLPVRAIAKQLDLTPESAHQEYRMARVDFRRVLEDVVAAHYPGDAMRVSERCREVMGLLGDS